MPAATSVLIIADPSELSTSGSSWGTGKWLEPQAREALDWFTLVRLLGWRARVVSASGDELPEALEASYRCVLLATAPQDLGRDSMRRIANQLPRSEALWVFRDVADDSPLSPLQGFYSGAAVTRTTVRGKTIAWHGPGGDQTWRCRQPVEATAWKPTDAAHTLATLDDAPVIVVNSVGQSTVVTLGFQPSAARDQAGAVTSLLRKLLIFTPSQPTAWFDWDDTVVLRMDDPGGAQNVYNQNWSYTKLGEGDWARFGETLQRHDAQLSIGYVPGWIDDGDGERGELRVSEERVARRPGAVHPSPRVRYTDKNGLLPGTLHDYVSEFSGLRRLQREGRVGLELHGYTHVHPDAAAWLRAPDRWENNRWYRELGKGAAPFLDRLPLDEHPIARGYATLHEYFDEPPTTLICPGEEFTDAALAVALQVGLRLVGSYYLAFRCDDRFHWNQHICSPYLNEAESHWFDAGLPVIGYFHDRDLVVEGLDEFAAHLESWKASGARRFVDYRHLAAALSKTLNLEESDEGLRLTVHEEEAVHSPTPLRIRYTTSAVTSESVPKTIVTGTPSPTEQDPRDGENHCPRNHGAVSDGRHEPVDLDLARRTPATGQRGLSGRKERVGEFLLRPVPRLDDERRKLWSQRR